jgi:hypothetical protein
MITAYHAILGIPQKANVSDIWLAHQFTMDHNTLITERMTPESTKNSPSVSKHDPTFLNRIMMAQL